MGYHYYKIAMADAKVAKAEVNQMKDNLKLAVNAMKTQDTETASAALDQVEVHENAVREVLNKPLWKKARKISFFDNDFKAVDDTLDLVDEATTEVFRPLIAQFEEYPVTSLKVDNGFDVGKLKAYMDLTDSLTPQIQSVASKMEVVSDELSKTHLNLDKDGKIAEYKEKLLTLNTRFSDLTEYMPLFKAIIGDGSDRYYLFAAQNSSEVRASGGFPGSIGNISIQDGILRVGDFESVYNVLSYSTPASAGVTAQENELFANWMNYPRDACYNPDFSRVAKVWAESYRSASGKSVDGVLSLSPVIIQRMLAVYGEITLSDGTSLNGDNATQVIEHDIYFKYLNKNTENNAYSNDIADALFAETAKKTMELFTENFRADAASDFLDIFTQSAKDRTLLFWLADEEEQKIVDDYGCSGSLNAGVDNAVTGVYFSGSDPSKMGWFFNLDTEVKDSVKNADGSTTYTVTAVLGNAIDQALSTRQVPISWVTTAVQSGATFMYLPQLEEVSMRFQQATALQ